MCRCKYAWWMVLKLNVFEDVVCSIDIVSMCVVCFNLYSIQHQEGIRLHVHGGGAAM